MTKIVLFFGLKVMILMPERGNNGEGGTTRMWVKSFQIFPITPQTSASVDVYITLSRSPSAFFLVFPSQTPADYKLADCRRCQIQVGYPVNNRRMTVEFGAKPVLKSKWAWLVIKTHAKHGVDDTVNMFSFTM